MATSVALTVLSLISKNDDISKYWIESDVEALMLCLMPPLSIAVQQQLPGGMRSIDRNIDPKSSLPIPTSIMA
nr:MAG TPA: hypothetical protein [Caudoviricetes sp.]